MKNIKLIVILTHLLIGTLAFAQAPEKMSYQAVIRNTANALVTNQPVGMKISILQGSATGTAVYAETQTPTSNTNGLVSLEIGGGSVVTGTFAGINWGNGPYFIKTETDPTGGSSYTITGTSQLVSSPYALYAKTSGSSTPGPQGPAGTNGQGVPTGGTANQVLAKVDGTNYNTAWVTPASGSASIFPSIELRVAKTAAQSLAGNDPTVAQTTTGEAVVYSATNHANAVLTGGNTWDGTTFTVGSTGAGWYQLTSQLMANNTASSTANSVMSMLIEINAAAGSSIFGTTTYSLGNIAMPGFNIRSVATGVVYLAAGDVVKVKAKGGTATAALALRTDGSTNFSVVRLK